MCANNICPLRWNESSTDPLTGGVWQALLVASQLVKLPNSQYSYHQQTITSLLQCYSKCHIVIKLHANQFITLHIMGLMPSYFYTSSGLSLVLGPGQVHPGWQICLTCGYIHLHKSLESVLRKLPKLRSLHVSIMKALMDSCAGTDWRYSWWGGCSCSKVAWGETCNRSGRNWNMMSLGNKVW